MRLQITYLQDILDRIARLETIASEGKPAFFDSFILQDAAIRNFEVLGEAVKHLSPELTTSYPEIAWKSIAGFRDVLIHDYARINLDIVWDACVVHLPPLKAAAQDLLDRLNAQEGDDGE